MKKLLSCVLMLSMLIGLFSVSSISFVSAATAYATGDINMDSSVNTSDVRLMLRAIVGNVTITAQQRTLGDVDNDGSLTTSDAHILMVLIANPTPVNMETIDLLAPTADDWYNPVLRSSGSAALVTPVSNASGGYVFNNFGGTWPYTLYIYEDQLLLPDNAYIEYDLTVSSDSASINLFLGGETPDITGDSGSGADQESDFVKLNSYISATNIDAGSGDLTTGTYKGSIRVGDLAVSNSSKVNGMAWVSGIKIYVTGSSGSSITIRKLQAKGYKETRMVQTEIDPAYAVRSSLINTTETEGLSALTSMRLYQNSVLMTGTSLNASWDNKKFYDTEMKRRVVNYADGYQMDIMKDWEPDYRLSELRSRYSSSDYCLTVTMEDKSPYDNTVAGWTYYLEMWLNMYIADASFLNANNLAYQRTPITTTSMLSGYTVMQYDIEIRNANAVAMPYYSIAIVRKDNVYNKFFLFVLKSSAPTTSVIDRVVRSFKEVSQYGQRISSQGQYQQVIPSSWNSETLAYYNKLCNQTTTDWGFFSYSMPQDNESYYQEVYDNLAAESERLKTALNYTPQIMPTYSHLMFGNRVNKFPSGMASAFAGGNGFNGKPVLQFSYQFTSSNNTSLNRYTPMYDVIRGKFDTTFKNMATQIKAYGKPVLLRLNNEMNTDWTSYCGMVTLLDPDIFVLAWQRMYDIFEANGVDNCIWIFNPVAVTAPYCRWGEDLCYMPGEQYVQIFGLTSYEMGNYDAWFNSFQSLYTAVYNKSNANFGNLPWVISEFACGAGGEREYNYNTGSWDVKTLGRNQAKQAQWVSNMFTCLNNRNAYGNTFCKNIKGAVWFSVNDLVDIDGTSYITNYLKLDASLSSTLMYMKNGLAGSGATH